MRNFSYCTIPHPFIALFGSGNSIHDISPTDFEAIKAHAFVITLNYAPIHLLGHLNMWSDRNVSDFLETHYHDRPKDCLFLAQEGRVSQNFQHKIDFWFNRQKEKLQGNYTIVWALQLLKKYFPEKKILLFGVDLYTQLREHAKWYDQYTDFDRQRRGPNYKADPKLQQCGAELTRLIPSENIFNCNPKSKLVHFRKKDWREIFQLRILHVASTPLAGAPVHLSQIINRYTGCESKTVLLQPFLHHDLRNLQWPYDIVKPPPTILEELYAWCDIVHYHGLPSGVSKQDKPALLQYHSEPANYKPGITHAGFNGRKLVIAQYHPRFYSDACIVPNLIDIWEEKFRPGSKSSQPIRIFYSWASESKSKFGNKGSQATKALLQKLRLDFPKQIELDIFHNTPYDVCMEAKRKAHICIDECVTGSYHLQSLEGCAVGAATFNHIDDTTFSYMQKVSGSKDHPFLKSSLHELDLHLRQLILDREKLAELGHAARQWMETYWDPRKLIATYITAYFNVLWHHQIIPSEPFSTLNGHTSKQILLKEENKINHNGRSPSLSSSSSSPPIAFGNPIPERQSVVSLFQRYAGQDVYIFGAGPSILKINPEDYKDKICLGINFAFEVIPYLTYTLIHDLDVYEIVRNVMDNHKLILPETLVNQSSTLPGQRHLPHRIRVQNDQACIYPIQDPYENNIINKKLSLQKDASIFTWSSTTHSAIHLAAYMGAKNIFLIGVDYSLYPDGRVHFISKHSTIYSQQHWNAHQKHRQGDEWLQKELAKNGIKLENMSSTYLNHPVQKVEKQSLIDGPFIGNYVKGIGKAHQVAQSEARSTLLRQLFGCALIGTFNIRTSENTDHVLPVIIHDHHKFNFIKISLPDGQYQYGWSYRFAGSKQKGNILEVYTKQTLSEDYKTQQLKINFFPKWTREKILQWEKGKYWFQGFSWLSNQRADSVLLWNLMKHEDYQKKTVLDFGTHYGYFAFQASKNGAIVEAIDQDSKNIQMACTINENIEQQDVMFSVGSTLPDRNYDYIFELSVYHWMDESYHNLPQHLEVLKKRCKFLFLELINPPLKGKLSQREVDDIVGGEKLLHYKHKVRRTRTLYKLSGYQE